MFTVETPRELQEAASGAFGGEPVTPVIRWCQDKHPQLCTHSH